MSTPVATPPRAQPAHALDTPAKASRISRPQTRHWQRLLTEASSHHAQATDTRAVLRSHLAAADRLQKKRTQLHIRRHTTHLQNPASDWQTKQAALHALATTRDASVIHAIAPHLGAQLADMRSMLVIAASHCIQQLAPLFTPEHAAHIIVHALSSVHATKKIMVDARTNAALSLATHNTDAQFWHQVMSKLTSPHAQTRSLVVHAFKCFVRNPQAQAAQTRDTLHSFLKPLVEATVVDKNVNVRQSTKQLIQAHTLHFGKQSTDHLLQQLHKSVSDRLQTVLGHHKPATAQRITMKQLIKQKRQAMQKTQPVPTSDTSKSHDDAYDVKQIARNDQENVENHS